MSRLIKSLTMTLVLVIMLLVSVTGTVFANQQIEGPDFGIEVSPNVLNVGSASLYGHIHSNIPFAGVDLVSVELWVDGEEYTDTILAKEADDCGHLVVKFNLNDQDLNLKNNLTGQDEAVFELTYEYLGVEYTNTDTIDVIQPNTTP